MGKGQEVPHALSKLDHIHALQLDFWENPVVIPEWLDKIPIDELRIMGKLTDEEEAQLRQRFPKAEIERVENLFKGFKKLPVEESKETKPVKAGNKISGTVSEDLGPLMGATVCEVDAQGRIVESAITDINGRFVMKVQNPENRLRFSYPGMITETRAIDKKKYKIMMQSIMTSEPVTIRIQRRVH